MAKKIRKKTVKRSKVIMPATSVRRVPLAAPGPAVGVGNVINAAKLAEKTIELTACAQYANQLGAPMVWFGLTQKQERQHGFDAATNLGGRAFILQFKASSTILKTGTYASTRRFCCQHHQMQLLKSAYGSTPGCCFYFLPNLGTFAELNAVHGDLLNNSFLVDVADLPQPIPATHRQSGYHYAYLDAQSSTLTVTSEPFKLKLSSTAKHLAIKKEELGIPSEHLIEIARTLEQKDEGLGDMFFKNAALVVVL